MPDILFVSSVFKDIKIAEPMGASILAACLREKGFDVEILEPSLDGWSIEKTVQEVAVRKSPIIGISMLRDKHVNDVLKFCILLRKLCPDRFICVGGHGPSIAVNAIDSNNLPEGWNILPDNLLNEVPSDVYWKQQIPPTEINQGPIVNAGLVDRGKGAGDISTDDESLQLKAALDQVPYKLSMLNERESPYFDKSKDYLRIMKFVDTYMLGESDTNLPLLVERVLKGEPWQDLPGLAYLDDKDRLIRTAPPPKVVDLGTLPHMARDIFGKYQEKYGKDIPVSILASRGCYYSCTFCSVVQYEQLQVGSKHRQRPNKDIVDEIKILHENFGVTHFNFEDDNFIIKSQRGIQKLHELCDELLALDFKMKFAFFCRADAVSEELFRHMRDAGLVGIYFGMESVHPTDLEFFHKGASEQDNFRALDILLSLGFSLKAGSDLRIMLGYITWHPLTSFESLRATSDFIKKYGAPPKLLRRKLRPYSGTDVVKQIASLGLLNPDNKDGWDYQDPMINGLDHRIDNYFGMVNKIRDQLRTIEKASSEHGYSIEDLKEIQRCRRRMDDGLLDYFDKIVEIASSIPQGGVSPEVKTFDLEMRDSFNVFLAENRVKELISNGYAACGFEAQVVDLFRK